mgnify:CR=1 FL=1|tara:strand:- start:57 stop:290 length:234 start_codon:yes stop_codon:yes gene_type:complete
MIGSKVIKALNECHANRATDLTPEEIHSVIDRIEEAGGSVEKLLEVSDRTLTRWRSGENQPKGRNKMIFYYILNYKE